MKKFERRNDSPLSTDLWVRIHEGEEHVAKSCVECDSILGTNLLNISSKYKNEQRKVCLKIQRDWESCVKRLFVFMFISTDLFQQIQYVLLKFEKTTNKI